MVLIDYIESRQIINSRGEPTVEATVFLNNGENATASVPSGKSRSANEAIELVDKEFNIFFGKSVNHAVTNINTIISPRLKKMDPLEQEKIDQILNELDNTPNKAHLGANAILAVSMAVAKSAALIKKKQLYIHLNDLFIKLEAKNRYDEPVLLSDKLLKPQLPIPALNMINGGVHADTKLSVQEYMIVPVGLPKMFDKIRAASEINTALREVLKEKGKSTNIGDEGGYATSFDNPYEPLECLVEAVKRTGYNVHNQVLYGLDVAGSQLENPLPTDFFDNIITNHPIISIEDPFGENDWEDFAALNKAYPNIFITGDDLTSMILDRLYKAIEIGAIDCVIIKPNQIGTITETLRFAKVAKDAGQTLFAAHRSGETNDTFIVDLAVAIGAQFIKAGNIMRGERVAKYNHLLTLAQFFEI